MGFGTMRKICHYLSRYLDLRVPGNGVTSSHGVFVGDLEVPARVCFPGFNLALEISTSNA